MSKGKLIFPISQVNNLGLIGEVVREFTDTVSSTLGPGGRTVIIGDSSAQVPHVTKDGVTVAESIHYDDNFRESIVALLKESARKTAEEVGDGTTTSTLLAGKLIELGILCLPKVKNRRNFFIGMKDYGDRIVDYLDDCKKLIVDDREMVKNIVRISSNNDADVVELLSTIVDDIGADGLINVELIDSDETTVSISEGASIESNCIPIGGNPSDLEDPRIVLIEGSVKDIHEIRTLLETLHTSKHSAVIIAKDFSQDVIRNITVNNTKGTLKIDLVAAEGFGSHRLDILNDIATISGATIVSTDGSTEKLLRSFSQEFFGRLKKSVVTSRSAILVPYPEILDSQRTTIESTISELKASLLSPEFDEGMIRNVKRRLSKYNKVATISVGGFTQAEALERKDRIDDAVCAISSGINGGIIPGAGSVLYTASRKLRDTLDEVEDNDFKLGAGALLTSCRYPLELITSNAGFEVKSFNFDELKDDYTINAIEGTIVNAYDSGIIDPVMASVQAIVNAVSIAKTLLNSHSFVIENEDG